MAAGSQQYPAGALYVVGTPIGNLADLTLRAIHVLQLADVVACEDTRMTQRLLQHLGLSKRLMAVHEHNENEAAQGVVAALQAGQRVAYVSDAGTPGVSDPGARLVRAVHAAGLRAVPIPGASAPVSALSVAGDAVAQGFTFAGFLPNKGGARREALARLAGHCGAVVLFESPHRVLDLARDLAAQDPARLVTIGREITKQFEEVATVAAGALPTWLGDEHRQRGEFVLVWHARAPESSDEAQAAALPEPLLEVLRPLSEQLPLKQAARLLSDLTGLPKGRLYDEALRWRQDQDQQDDSGDEAD